MQISAMCLSVFTTIRQKKLSKIKFFKTAHLGSRSITSLETLPQNDIANLLGMKTTSKEMHINTVQRWGRLTPLNWSHIKLVLTHSIIEKVAMTTQRCHHDYSHWILCLIPKLSIWLFNLYNITLTFPFFAISQSILIPFHADFPL